ncbi:MAG TPA: malonic semialdehyde reductase [Micropepsaceae bacterium]|nr:malonic semialdehyde reductase [Micropepsaceae bacterium]
MSRAVNDEALDILFRKARTHRKWRPEPVTQAMLMAIYDLMRWGPTTNNTTPARITFIVSPDAKERLKPHLNKGNVEQTMLAPATAIIGYDLAFYEAMGKLSPNPDARESWSKKSEPELAEAAFRNGSLQGAYFIVAARALGLDCGPMGGFDHDGVDREFFAGTKIKSNFLCNLGHGDDEGLRLRAGRLDFDEACRIL